ncbi:flavodoxin reductase [Candidatus Pacearchaeota archaeon]|nr:flavodoxin reductase [Candidatus Pacearchaeota archaeon]MBD3283807.1 flavodoxin reductase [Candidatus Pacearchaeota archaeon]
MIIKILEIEEVSRNVKRFKCSKPESYIFMPGQAALLSVNQEEWKEQKRPFTFVSLPSENYLEFVIKQYPEKNGVTKKIHELQTGEEFVIGEPFGIIKYHEKGVFLAGGTGVTPFLCIFKDLRNKNLLNGNFLIFSNKTKEDVILEKELRNLLGKNVVFTLTEEDRDDYEKGRINSEMIKKYVKDFDSYFYVCGPNSLTEDLKRILKNFHVDGGRIVF